MGVCLSICMHACMYVSMYLCMYQKEALDLNSRRSESCL